MTAQSTGGCEKIKICMGKPWEILLVVRGPKKFAPPKSAGHFSSPKGIPDFRRGTLSCLIKARVSIRRFSMGTTKVQWTPTYEEINASFWQANFSGPRT
jgi:hypothetical protein